jgi:hypothetical protein
MYMLISYPVGIIVEALVLVKGRNHMRVAAAGFPDTIELRRAGTQWFTETRQPVEFDFLMSNVHVSESDFCSRAAGVAQAGGAAA